MFGITTLKRSILGLAAAAALLAAAGPASAGTAVGNPGDPPARGSFMDYTDDACMDTVKRVPHGTGDRGIATSEVLDPKL